MSRQLNVYLYGKKTGVLLEDDLGHLQFQYDSGAELPLSVRLPVRSEVYDAPYAEPFFNNLTPEGEALKILAEKLHFSDDNSFSILARISGECAGAVSLYEGDMAGWRPENTRLL